jgi:transposase
MTYVSIDVHKASSTFRWWIPASEQTGRLRIETSEKTFAELLGKLPQPWVVAIEATRQAPAACIWLNALGADIHLVDPEKMDALNKLMSAKTDDKDARSMLQALIHDFLPEAYLAPPDVVERRALTRGHNAMRRIATCLRNHLRIALCQAGIECDATDLTGKTARLIVPGLIDELAPNAGMVARMYWVQLQVVEQSLEEVDQHIKQEVAADPVATKLCEHPGIGPITALGLMAEIGDATRFPKDKKLHSYAGVTPRSFQTDKFVANGRIRQRCNKHLRYWAVTAAQSAARCKAPSKAKATYDRIKLRRHPNTAKIAASRAILSFVYNVWTHTPATTALAA